MWPCTQLLWIFSVSSIKRAQQFPPPLVSPLAHLLAAFFPAVSVQAQISLFSRCLKSALCGVCLPGVSLHGPERPPSSLAVHTRTLIPSCCDPECCGGSEHRFDSTSKRTLKPKELLSRSLCGRCPSSRDSRCLSNCNRVLSRSVPLQMHMCASRRQGE